MFWLFPWPLSVLCSGQTLWKEFSQQLAAIILNPNSCMSLIYQIGVKIYFGMSLIDQIGVTIHLPTQHSVHAFPKLDLISTEYSFRGAQKEARTPSFFSNYLNTPKITLLLPVQPNHTHWVLGRSFYQHQTHPSCLNTTSGCGEIPQRVFRDQDPLNYPDPGGDWISTGQFHTQHSSRERFPPVKLDLCSPGGVFETLECILANVFLLGFSLPAKESWTAWALKGSQKDFYY